MSTIAMADAPVAVPLKRGGWSVGRAARGVASAVEWLFGAVALVVGLAVVAAMPIAQFVSLGYLLEAGGRIARSGRFRDGFVGIRLAARLGGIVFACWLMLWPVRFVSDLAWDAQIIDASSLAAQGWRVGTFALVCLIGGHLLAAIARGGKLRFFFWPFNLVWLIRRIWRGGYYAEARDTVWATLVRLRLPYLFWLGVRGFVAAFAWLVLPVTLLVIGHEPGGGRTLLGFVGGFLLAVVLLYLPFLQMRMAAHNRFVAAFEWRAMRLEFARAPWAYAVSLIVTLAFAVPLYLLKIELIPAEAAWLPSLVFIAFNYPTRLLTGWSLARAAKREEPRHWFWRWTGRLPLLPVALLYVIILFFSQYTSWNGVWSLYEQHAFLLPVPF